MQSKISELKNALPAIPIENLTKKTANEHTGPCPKCGGVNRFQVWPETGRFWCRPCGWKGDVIDYHCHIEGVDVPGLMAKYLSSDRPITVPPIKKKTIDPKPKTDVNAEWNGFRIDADTIQKFLAERLIGIDVVATALQSDNLRITDFYGNVNLCCAFRNLSGEIQTFQKIYRDKSGKYQKPFATGHKADGFFFAGSPFETAGTVVIVESVINALTIGDVVPNACALATGGSTMTAKLHDLKKCLSEKKRVIIFFDHDEAGRKATLKAVEILPGAVSIKWDHRFPDGFDANDLLKIPDEALLNSFENADDIPEMGEPAIERMIREAIPITVPTVPEVKIKAVTVPELSTQAQKLAKEIEKRLVSELGIDDAETISSLKINPLVIDRMIQGAFWSGQKSKLFLLNRDDSLTQFLGGEAYDFLARTFGKAVDAGKVRELAENIEFETPTQSRKFVERVTGIHKKMIMDHLKYHNQRESIEWRVDMFSTQNRMVLREDDARLILTHKPFSNGGGYDLSIIQDFKDHFPRFDELLEFIVMSRFVMDRKKSYLWIQADSDWGKGFLLGVFKSMGCCVELSIAEIESILEGKPSGRSPKDFKRAFVLVIDEFKTVKSELKQLQSEITLSPKNQLASSVEVFSKLFLSAESVGSLVTDNGVEDQFANRMSIFKETGSLVTRPLYRSVGNPKYFQSVLAYTIETVNAMVERMRAVDRIDAQTEAGKWLDAFIRRNGLDTLYERFSSSLPDVASEISRYWRTVSDDRIVSTDTGTFVRNPSKMLEEYFERHFDKSMSGSMRKKKQELIELISDDGKGVKPCRINGELKKAIRLKGGSNLF